MEEWRASRENGCVGGAKQRGKGHVASAHQQENLTTAQLLIMENIVSIKSQFNTALVLLTFFLEVSGDELEEAVCCEVCAPSQVFGPGSVVSFQYEGWRPLFCVKKWDELLFSLWSSFVGRDEGVWDCAMVVWLECFLDYFIKSFCELTWPPFVSVRSHFSAFAGTPFFPFLQTVRLPSLLCDVAS